MRWASVGACILSVSRASEVLWAVSDVTAGLSPPSVWHYQQEPTAYGGAGRRMAAEPKQVFGDADRHRRHIDPLVQAASDLHLAATASWVYCPHVLDIDATRALTATA